MRNYFLTLIYFLCFIGFLSLGTAGFHIVEAGDEVIPNTERPKQIAEAFKALRTIRGHFAGGTWNDNVDRWMGLKHRLMLQLSTLIAESNYSKSYSAA